MWSINLILFISSSYIYVRCVAARIPVQANETNLQIINGREVKPHSAPFMVFVRSLRKGVYHQCGGVLISEKYALTAGHCLEHIDRVYVILGAHDLLIEDGYSQSINVDHHYLFSDTTIDDIGIMRLQTPAKLTVAVQPAKLPKRNSEYFDYELRVGTVYGWGQTESGKPSNVLRSANLPVVSKEECNTYYGKLYDGEMCIAVVRGKQAFFGDSGGPFLFEDRVLGLVKGAKLHEPSDIPTTYTRLDYYLEWIEEKTDVFID